MNRLKVLFLTLLIAMLSGMVVAAEATALPVVPLPDGTVYGVFDPDNSFEGREGITIEQRFVVMRLESTVELTTAIEEIRTRGRFPLIALETWPWENWGMTRATLLDDLANGWYDNAIRPTCQAIAAQAPQQVWIRLNHEMDLLDLFPWSQGNPAKYVAAFRHFVTVCREEASNISFMWSPAGDSRAMEFYPGDDVVDLVGLTILGYEPWDLAAGAYQAQSMNSLLNNKWSLVYQTGKPIVVAELGVCCDVDHQREWLRTGYSNWARYGEQLRAVVYFQDVNPSNSWGLNMTPDWRIQPEWFPPPMTD